jgi:GMP synthase PP-ATPase subunit
MNSPKFTDVVIVYKDLETGKEHQEKDHYKLEEDHDKNRFLKSLVGFENPKIKDKVILKRVRFYEFFGNKVKESFSRQEFNQIDGYSDMLEVKQKEWKREEAFDTLEIK